MDRNPRELKSGRFRQIQNVIHTVRGAWLFLAMWALMIFCFSQRSSFPVEMPFERFDLVVHFVLYSVLGASVMRVMRYCKQPFSFSVMLFAISITTLYGLSDEVHQLFVVGRTFAISDLVADATGAVVGVLAYVKAKTKNIPVY